jgi:hypothetical protein
MSSAEGSAAQSPRSSWAAQAAAEPSFETVAALDAADPADMAGSELVDAIVTCERAISHLQATQAALTAAFARPDVAGDLTDLTDNLTRRTGAARGPDGRIDPDLLAAHQQDYARSLAASEIAAALAIPHRTATNRVTSAMELVDQLPATWTGLHTGRIDQRRATLIADGTRCLPSDVRAAAEDVIVPLAGSRISTHVKELLERAVIAADPDAATKRERDARDRRHVRHRPGENGTGDVTAHVRAEDAVTLYTLLDLLAQASAEVPDEDGHHRDIDARRADALTDIANELLATGRIDLTGYGQASTSGAETDPAEDAASPADTAQHSESADDLANSTRVTPDRSATRVRDESAPAEPDAHNPAPAGPATHHPRPHNPKPHNNPAPAEPDAHNPAPAGPATHHPKPHYPKPHNDPAPAEPDAHDPAPAGPATHHPRFQTGRHNTSTDPAPAADNAAPSGESAWRGLSRHGRRPHLTVTIGMSTLAGLDRLPGHLAGHGAITAELASTIAQAYQTMALAGIDGETGTAQAVSATVYRPRQALADQITTLATHCRFPACRQPGWRSDHDHRVPFNHFSPGTGGLTTLWDCDPECRRHHLLKTHGQWNSEGRPDRSIDWTSPTGHHYATRPTEYRLPGEGSDDVIDTLILPATWPAPEPEPPEEDPSPGSLPPSPEMLRFLTRVRQREQHFARLRAVGERARRILAGYRAPTPEQCATAATTPETGPATGDAPDPNGHRQALNEILHPPTRRRQISRRDYLDGLTVDRAIRRATGQPDPNDEPPPF